MSNKTARSDSIVPSPVCCSPPTPACGDTLGWWRSESRQITPPLPKGDGAQRNRLRHSGLRLPLCPTRGLCEQLLALGERAEPWLCSGLGSTSMFHQGRGRLSWGGPRGCRSHLLVKAMLVKQLPSWAGFWPETFNYVTQWEWKWGFSPFSHFFLFEAICWQREAGCFPPVGHHRAFLGSGVYGGHLEPQSRWTCATLPQKHCCY